MNRHTRIYIRLLAMPTFVIMFLLGMYLVTKEGNPKDLPIIVDRYQNDGLYMDDKLPDFEDNLDDVLQDNVDEEPHEEVSDDLFHDDTMDEYNQMHMEDNNPVILEADIVDKFLKATTNDVINTKRMQFIKNVKNPCFALDSNYQNVGNINMDDVIRENYDIRCFPHVILAGFSGSGTDDLLRWITSHRHVTTGTNFPVPRNDTSSQQQQHPHFWDNHSQIPDYSIKRYTDLYKEESSRIKEGFRTGGSDKDLLIIDATPNTIWFGDNWKDDDINYNRNQPSLLLPHKIHHVIPKTKFIIMLRNPSERLIQDYASNYQGEKSPEDFLKKVLTAIEWWKHCLEDLSLPLRSCATGASPHPTLDIIDFQKCSLIQGIKDAFTNISCQDAVSWTKNPADRLRTGLYYAFLDDWLKIFPRQQFLFIKFENYVADPIGTLEHSIVPFLNLPPLTSEERQSLKLLEQQTKSLSNLNLNILELTRSLIDDFYQLPVLELGKVLGTKQFYWKPNFIE